MRLHIAFSNLFLFTLLDFAQSQDWIILDTYEYEDLTYQTVLDGGGKYYLSWTPPDDKVSDSKIIFKVEVRAKGYFGLGFSTNGGMTGSDIVTGWIKDDEIYFQDRHALSFSLPVLDSSQDYELIDAFENDTFTVFEFSRKLDTCDEDDMVIDDSTMRVIYAFSEEDPNGNDPFYHRQNRGSKSIMLLQGKLKVPQDPKDYSSLLTWDITAPDIDISDEDTLYWCKIFRSPQLSYKHHIVLAEPLIQEGHEQFVHHMILYECVGATPAEYEPYLNYRGHQCFHPNMPIEMQKCQGLTVGWAVGGQGMVLPEHAGLPLDPAPGKYFMFEIHYDNPQVQNGIVDHSGLRIYYTPNLRTYDAGCFAVGAVVMPQIIIPPGQKEYVVTAHSSPECITSKLPDTGVKAFGVLLHAHTAGRGIKVRHFRGNQELAPIAEDKNYDFNYQQHRLFPQEVEILKDDQITVECTYDTSMRGNLTYGGLSTREEMCFVFLLYYPLLSNSYMSLSGPSFEDLSEVFRTNVRNEIDVLRASMFYDWRNADIPGIQNKMRNSRQVSMCYVGPYPPAEDQIFTSYPEDFVPYESPSKCRVSK